MTTEVNSAFSHSSTPDVLLALKFEVVQKHKARQPFPPTIKALEVAFSDRVSETEQNHPSVQCEISLSFYLSLSLLQSSSGRQLLVLATELMPLSRHCSLCLQPSDAFVAFERYLRRSQERLELLESLSGEVARCAAFTEEDEEGVGVGGVGVEFRNDNGVSTCVATWRLEFRRDMLDFETVYAVKFTQSGLKSAEEVSFPEELLRSGHCRQWNAAYCFKNLERMTRLDEAEEEDSDDETEAKKARRSGSE